MSSLYSINNKMNSIEWNARCQLAALYRLIAYYRMTDLIDTHISFRLPNEPSHFLINQYGIPFEKMTASNLVKIDHDGCIVEDYDQNKKVNAAGFVIHSAIHRARADVNCIIHTHTADGVAVSAQKNGLLPLSQHALKFYENIGYHDYEGIALSLDEQQRLVNDLSSHRCMILRNHGLLATGESIPRAFHEIYFLERACQIQVKAMMSSELNQPSLDVCRHTAAQFNREDVEQIIEDAWLAALSLIEHQQDEYCK